MKKRRITLNLDEDVVEALEAAGGRSMSSVANDALREALDVAAHRAALREWLDELDEKNGAPSPEQFAAAKALLDAVKTRGDRRDERRVNVVVVLDTEAFDLLDSQRATGRRALLRSAIDDGGKVYRAAVTLAEVCRGVSRTRRVEAALARRRGGQRIRIVPTEERFAKLVGAILHDTASGSERIADAPVVAACTTADAAIVLTADPEGIAALATAAPAPGSSPAIPAHRCNRRPTAVRSLTCNGTST